MPFDLVTIPCLIRQNYAYLLRDQDHAGKVALDRRAEAAPIAAKGWDELG